MAVFLAAARPAAAGEPVRAPPRRRSPPGPPAVSEAMAPSRRAGPAHRVRPLVSVRAGPLLPGRTRSTREPAAKTPLYGIWNVEELDVDGQARPPLVTDETRWRRVIFDCPRRLAIQLMDDSRQRYMAKLDPMQRTLALTRRGETKALLTPHLPVSGEGGWCCWRGMARQKVRAKLRKTAPKKFLLVTRGFHWINENPFNR